VMFGAVAGPSLCCLLGPDSAGAMVGAVAILATVEISHSAAAILADEAPPVRLVTPNCHGRLAGVTDGMPKALFGPRGGGDEDRLVWVEGVAAGGAVLGIVAVHDRRDWQGHVTRNGSGAAPAQAVICDGARRYSCRNSGSASWAGARGAAGPEASSGSFSRRIASGGR
jgi:hypothetical protein